MKAKSDKPVGKYNQVWIIFNTIVCAAFIIVGLLAALSLRGDLKFTAWFDMVLGSVLLVFVIAKLLTTIYNSNNR